MADKPTGEAILMHRESMKRIIALLDGLAYGPATAEGSTDVHAAWRQKLFSQLGGWPGPRIR